MRCAPSGREVQYALGMAAFALGWLVVRPDVLEYLIQAVADACTMRKSMSSPVHERARQRSLSRERYDWLNGCSKYLTKWTCRTIV